MDLFKLLNLGSNFTITETSDGYDVEVRDADLLAHVNIEFLQIKYYVTDCYNCGTQYLEIDMESLSKLKEFCELIIKLEKEV